jgi:hypothetical protein
MRGATAQLSKPGRIGRNYLRLLYPRRCKTLNITKPQKGEGVLKFAREAAIEEYLRWNEAIGRVLFEGEFAAKPAYLQLEPEILARVAEAAGHASDDEPRDSLVSSVRRTLGLDRVPTPFLHHIAQAELWEEDGRQGYPPYLALLAMLVLAAQDMVADADHASHNYYGRLEELLDLDAELWRRAQHHFRDTVAFWLGFNDWLDDWEGERGLATAAVLDRRVLISYPLSQALVRAADRVRLREAFLDYGLTPGRRLAPAEMRWYLDDWLTGQGAGLRLGRLWKGSAEARERIVDIARAELAAWAGERAAGAAASSQRGTQRLLWAAELRDGALPAIDLYLTTRADPASIDGGYEVIEPSDAAAREAVATCEDALELTPLPGCEMASLEPWSRIGAASLLVGALKIRRREPPHTELLHAPDPLVVLALDERDGWHREVSRAQLLEPCLVLAHEARAARVEQHLRGHARDGWRKLDAQLLDGLPAGWTAFLDVTIVAPADSEDARNKQVAALCPAPANALALSGGLRLGANAWHVDAPPEVVVTLEGGQAFGLAANCRRKLGEDAEDAALGGHVGGAAVPLSGHGLESGDYDVAATDGRGHVLAHGSLRLRSADHPRPAALERLGELGHAIADPLGVLTATDLGGAGPSARGAILSGDAPSASAPRLTLPPRPLQAASERVAHLAARSRGPDSVGRHQSCATLGYHYWICEPGFIGESTRTLKRMQCTGCQRQEWTVNRGRVQRRAAPARSAARIRVEPPRIGAPPRGVDSARPALDILLDAVTYVGNGSWDTLKQMARALSDDPMLAWQASRTLAALGHVDLRLDSKTFRMAGWQVAPAALAQANDGSWVLCGARSYQLVDALETALGGAASFEEEDGAPLVVRAPAMPEAEARALAGQLKAPLGGAIEVMPQAAQRLVAALRPLQDALPVLALARLPSRGHERFDLASGAWQPAGDPPRAGAYRVDLHGRLYGFADAQNARDGMMRVVDVLAAKHLAATAGGISLAGYDPRSRTLLTPMGAELPGLLGRAAALSSGLAPQLHAEAGLIAYRDVHPTVAQHIQRCLGIAA